jgi:hypothetical protein
VHLFSADPSDLRLHHSQLSEELNAAFGAAQPLESPPDAKEDIVRLQEIAREVSPASGPAGCQATQCLRAYKRTHVGSGPSDG